MSASPDSQPGESVAVTFRGRGFARLRGNTLSVLVCPRCSQRNAPKAADKGYCHWCAYEPSHEDIEPAQAA
jgi:ribosomal protein L40E